MKPHSLHYTLRATVASQRLVVWSCSETSGREPTAPLTVFSGAKADFSSKWRHSGCRIKGIRATQGLPGFCDNKWNITHGCCNTTFCMFLCVPRVRHLHCCNAHASMHTNTHRQGTDGCEEHTLASETREGIVRFLMNPTSRVTKVFRLQRRWLANGFQSCWSVCRCQESLMCVGYFCLGEEAGGRARDKKNVCSNHGTLSNFFEASWTSLTSGWCSVWTGEVGLMDWNWKEPILK